ncbi:hypothetical protein BT67DRAFT_89774 [Trichocladium antarcticum]|uniref:Uncharacterized protein n=1 Tax=Trichocladium antarcticum TaxID=1450529 RepID=A0AAN6UG77_9PEZI|nr:hypothetical protein BT67DRAFT_89774 [Trichocladium antarcticum]
MHSAIHLSAHLTTAHPAYIGSLGTVILILILGTNDHSFCAQVGNSPLLLHLPSYPPPTSVLLASESPRVARSTARLPHHPTSAAVGRPLIVHGCIAWKAPAATPTGPRMTIVDRQRRSELY